MHMTNTSVRHPPGLYVCFFSEMWERFGFYLMIGILFLFLNDPVAHGGMGMSLAQATEIVGSYAALVYFTPFVGGLIADRYLGYRKAIILGGLLLSLGYAILGYPGIAGIPYTNAHLFTAIAVIITGNGFFKPNISTLLGNLYNTDELKPRKDVAYNIFYMGINIGAFTCNFVAAYLRNRYGWGHAFAAASAGMLLGVVVFIIGMKHVRHADVIKPVHPGDMPFSAFIGLVFVPALLFGVIGWFVPQWLLGHALVDNRSNDAFLFACVPILGFYIYLWATAKGFDRRRIATLLIMFSVAVLFWNIYNQNATALTVWAENYTHRPMPAFAEKLPESLAPVQLVDTTPKVVQVIDEKFHTTPGPDGKPLTGLGLHPYFQNLERDRWPAPGQSLKLVSTEIFQSVNPFWIVLLSPIVVGFFGWLRARRMEPSTPSKIAIGIIISGISMVVMVVACLSTDIYHHKVSAGWIVASYGVFTVSELFLSPIGLSLTSKVAPKRITGMMMGGWFLTTSLGGKISGVLAGFWDRFDNKAWFFAISALGAVLAGMALLPLTKRLAEVVEEANASNE
jgi:POT family proton-dependent oligopeptide transporter